MLIKFKTHIEDLLLEKVKSDKESYKDILLLCWIWNCRLYKNFYFSFSKVIAFIEDDDDYDGLYKCVPLRSFGEKIGSAWKE